MRSIDPWIRRAGAVLALAGLASAAAADVLVVRAIGPSAARYRPGTVLADAQPVSLRAADVLTLLDANGSWTLQGPVRTTAGTRIRSAAAGPQLVGLNQRRARIGAVRGVGAGDVRPNLWMIDIAEPGAACIVAATHPVLWRKDAGAAGTTTLAGPGGASAAIEWTVGQTTHDWPATIPVTPDASYRLTGAGTGAGGTIELKSIDTAPVTITETGKALIAKGCAKQLDLLLAQEGGPPGTGG